MQKDIWSACIAGFLLCVGSLSIGVDPLWVTIVIFTLAIAAFASGWVGRRESTTGSLHRPHIEHPGDWV
jgi:hypothetical protein